MKDFEHQTLTSIRWTHREHVGVAALYVRRTPADAEGAMRNGITKLNASHGVQNSETSGYHETLTVAWVRLLLQLSESHPNSSEITFVNDALSAFADKRLLLTYYSREKIMSTEARRSWVEPDLLPLRLEQLEVGH